MAQDIYQWLEQARHAGLSSSEIQKRLEQAGWTKGQVNQVFAQKAAAKAAPSVDTRSYSGTTLPGVGALLKNTWSNFKNKIGRFLGISALFVIVEILFIVIAPIVFVSFIGISTITNMAFGSESLTRMIAGVIVPALIAAVIISILSSIIQAWLTALLIQTIHDTTKQKSFTTLLGESFKLLLPLWWVTILFTFFTQGAWLLFIIPGIIFLVWFNFAIFLPITEQQRGFRALLISKEYVRGYWWPVFGRLLAYWVITVGIGIAVMLAFVISSVSFGEILDANSITASIGQLLGLLIPFTVFALVVPFGMAYNYELYRALRSAKGNTTPDISSAKKGGIITTAIIGWIIPPLIIAGILLWGINIFNTFKDNPDFQAPTTITNSTINTNTATTTTQPNRSRLYTIRTAVWQYILFEQEVPQTLDELSPEYLSDTSDLDQYTYTVRSDSNTFRICTVPDDGTSEFCITADIEL